MRLEPLTTSSATHPLEQIQARGHWGFGLRLQHVEALLSWSCLPLLELIVEQFAFQKGGPNQHILQALVGRAPLLLHGLHLNIGGFDPLDRLYLGELGRLCQDLRPLVYSDHLAFTQMGGRQSFDLLPIPFTKSHQRHVIDRVNEVQDRLGRQLGLENISAYAAHASNTMPELVFLQGLADATGCGIVLDINNLYVNSHNFSFDPHAALGILDADSIVQYHCSGHSRKGSLLHDTHDEKVIAPVWQLLADALERFGCRPLILERDDTEVSLATLVSELLHLHSASPGKNHE